MKTEERCGCHIREGGIEGKKRFFEIIGRGIRCSLATVVASLLSCLSPMNEYLEPICFLAPILAIILSVNRFGLCFSTLLSALYATFVGLFFSTTTLVTSSLIPYLGVQIFYVLLVIFCFSLVIQLGTFPPIIKRLSCVMFSVALLIGVSSPPLSLSYFPSPSPPSFSPSFSPSPSPSPFPFLSSSSSLLSFRGEEEEEEEDTNEELSTKAFLIYSLWSALYLFWVVALGGISALIFTVFPIAGTASSLLRNSINENVKKVEKIFEGQTSIYCDEPSTFDYHYFRVELKDIASSVRESLSLWEALLDQMWWERVLGAPLRPLVNCLLPKKREEEEEEEEGDEYERDIKEDRKGGGVRRGEREEEEEEEDLELGAIQEERNQRRKQEIRKIFKKRKEEQEKRKREQGMEMEIEIKEIEEEEEQEEQERRSCFENFLNYFSFIGDMGSPPCEGCTKQLAKSLNDFVMCFVQITRISECFGAKSEYCLDFLADVQEEMKAVVLAGCKIFREIAENQRRFSKRKKALSIENFLEKVKIYDAKVLRSRVKIFYQDPDFNPFSSATSFLSFSSPRSFSSPTPFSSSSSLSPSSSTVLSPPRPTSPLSPALDPALSLSSSKEKEKEKEEKEEREGKGEGEREEEREEEREGDRGEDFDKKRDEFIGLNSFLFFFRLSVRTLQDLSASSKCNHKKENNWRRLWKFFLSIFPILFGCVPTQPFSTLLFSRQMGGAIQFGIAMVIGSMFSFIPPVVDYFSGTQYWIPLTIAFVMEPTSLQGTFKLTTLRIMGTISGSCVAYLAVALFGAENGAQYAIMFVWIIICAFPRESPSNGYAGAVAAFTFPLIIFGGGKDLSAQDAAIHRIELTFIGSFIVIIIWLLRPVSARRLLREGQQNILRKLNEEINLAYDCYLSVDSDPQVLAERVQSVRQLRAGLQKQRILVQEAVEEPFLWWPPFLPSPYLKLIAAEANLVQAIVVMHKCAWVPKRGFGLEQYPRVLDKVQQQFCRVRDGSVEILSSLADLFLSISILIIDIFSFKQDAEASDTKKVVYTPLQLESSRLELLDKLWTTFAEIREQFASEGPLSSPAALTLNAVEFNLSEMSQNAEEIWDAGIEIVVRDKKLYE